MKVTRRERRQRPVLLRRVRPMPLKTTELVLVHRQRVTGLIRKCVEAAAPAPQPEPQAPAAHPEAEAKPAGGAERQRERHDQQALSSRDSGHRTRHCGRPLRHTRIPDALQLPPAERTSPADWCRTCSTRGAAPTRPPPTRR